MSPTASTVNKPARRPYLLLRGLYSFATLTLLALLAVVLFEPGLPYLTPTPVPPARSEAALALLASAVEQVPLLPDDPELLADGAAFYPAELALIASAKNSIHLEAFIFHQTPIGQRFVDALAARARAGVSVRVVVDAFGGLKSSDHFFDPLRAAGGKVVWYQPFRWYTLKRWNNRTHRELLIVDGRSAFIGGAGIGSAWDSGTGTSALPPWRDLMVRINGSAARSLQAVFFQDWLEASGEILVEPESITAASDLLPARLSGQRAALVVASTPTGGRATRARVLFQLLVAAAREQITIDSPYFVPDTAMRRALTQATARGVRVTVITPGEHNNHLIARLASRRHYGELMAAGVRIFEYQPGMIHTKLMLVDGAWTVIGSTNLDNRSLGLNNEVNLLLREPAFAARLQKTVDGYLAQSREITLAEWGMRPRLEQVLAWFGSVLERQE